MKRFKILNGKLSVTEIALPSPGDNKLLVKIHAVVLNFRDLLVTEGIVIKII